jgi:hypothetical protein
VPLRTCSTSITACSSETEPVSRGRHQIPRPGGPEPCHQAPLELVRGRRGISAPEVLAHHRDPEGMHLERETQACFRASFLLRRHQRILSDPSSERKSVATRSFESPLRRGTDPSVEIRSASVLPE